MHLHSRTALHIRIQGKLPDLRKSAIDLSINSSFASASGSIIQFTNQILWLKVYTDGFESVPKFLPASPKFVLHILATARQLQTTHPPTQPSNRNEWNPHRELQERRNSTDLADVALGHGGRRGGCVGVGVREERHPLVLPGELVGGVHLLVAGRAERRLVRAAQHPRLRCPARVALDLHPR